MPSKTTSIGSGAEHHGALGLGPRAVLFDIPKGGEMRERGRRGEIDQEEAVPYVLILRGAGKNQQPAIRGRRQIPDAGIRTQGERNDARIAWRRR
jgi:hypothetical protein